MSSGKTGHDSFISVLAVIADDGDILVPFVEECIHVLKQNFPHYELMLIDDGSRDDTRDVVKKILGRFENVRYLRLSRRVGEYFALGAGLNAVIGDFVVLMNPNTDPPQEIPRILEQAVRHNGFAMGQAPKLYRPSFSQRTGRIFFHWYAEKILKLHLPRDMTMFRVMNRKMLNALIALREGDRLKHLLDLSSGHPEEYFTYTMINRRKKIPKRSLWEDLVHAKNLTLASSLHPLRFVVLLGLAASMLNLLYMGYIIAVYFFREQVAEGWTTLSLQMNAMFFMVFLILTVLAEYVGKILSDTKGAPHYFVVEEKHSNVHQPEERNVVHTSL